MSEPFVPNTFQRTTSKLVPQDWSLDEVTLEGWCQKEKGTDEFIMDNCDVSQLSEDYWNEESKPSVFKNALVNLSEGLASMHRKDILNSVSSNRKGSTTKTKNFNIKSTTNLSKKRLHSGRSKRSQKENQDSNDENLTGIVQQSEPNLPDRKTENMVESTRTSTLLQGLDLKTGPHNKNSQDDENNAVVDSTPQMMQENKVGTDTSIDMKDVLLPSENVLQSGKASIHGSEVESSSQLELDLESEKGPSNKKYHVLIKKAKQPMSQRPIRQIQKDDLRINKTLLQAKQIPSPLETITTLDTNKQPKRDSIPVLPVPHNPKNVAFIKELQIRNPQLKIDGIGQNRARQKENEITENLNLKKRPSEPLEVRNNNTSLRTVLGQAFKDAEAPPLFSLNLKGTSIGKHKDAAKENIKESVDYILGLYKDKNFEKTRTSEINPKRDSFKVTDNLKRTSYHPKAQPLNEKPINHEEGLNRANSRSQGRTDLGFRLKKPSSEFDDKKIFLPGTVKMNEIVFQ